MAKIPDFKPQVGVKIPEPSMSCVLCKHLKLRQGWERFPICDDCLRALRLAVAKQREDDSRDYSKLPPLDPEAAAHYDVPIGNGRLFAVPNPELHFGLFCDVIRKLGRGEYKELFKEAYDE